MKVANYKKHYYTKIFNSINRFPSYYNMTFYISPKKWTLPFPGTEGSQIIFQKNYLFYRPWRVDEVSPTTRQNIFTIFTIFFDAAASADGRRESESRRKIHQHVLSASRELQRTGERYY